MGTVGPDFGGPCLVALPFEPSLVAASLPLGAGWWPYFEFSGVMHPAVSHFPIALLTVAGLVEAWSVVRRHKRPANATLVCLSIGTFAAVVATVLGWADADRLGYSNGETISLHRWLGVAVAILAVAALVLSFVVHRANVGRKVVWAYRINVFAAAALVGLVGSLGGKLVHGEKYYEEAWTELAEATGEKVVDVAEATVEQSVDVAQEVVRGAADAIKSVPETVQAAATAVASPTPAALEATPATAPIAGPAPAPEAVAATTQASDSAAVAAAAAAPPTQPAAAPPTTAPVAAVTGVPASGAAFGGGRIDYLRDIQPIFEANCVKCHNEKKTKGDYRMDAVQHLFAAGETGATPIVAGKSDDSLLVKVIEGKGEYEDSIMPPKGDPLTFQEIALIRRWIDEGAQPAAAQ